MSDAPSILYFMAIKQVVRELEQKARGILAVIQAVHHNATTDNIKTLCEGVRSKMGELSEDLQKLATIIPTGQYYRFHDHWKFLLQKLVFLATFLGYLEKEELISKDDTAAMLKRYALIKAALSPVRTKWQDGFHLDLDDYLLGVLQMANELSRLCVNSVISGDYDRPTRIASFMSELDAAFRLLNLKNDAVRKRFDGLKYDMKKVEEIVYDLRIRGLKTESKT